MAIILLIEDVLHSGQIQEIPLGLVQLVDVGVPQIHGNGVRHLHLALDNGLHYDLVAALFVLIAILGLIREIAALVAVLVGVGRDPVLSVEVLDLVLLGLVDGLFYEFAVEVADEEAGDVDGAALPVVLHHGAHLFVSVDNDGHDCSEFLNVLDLFDEVAAPSIHHDNKFVTIEAPLFQMIVIEVSLLEPAAPVLIPQRIVHATAKNAVLIVEAEGAQAGANATFLGAA